MALSRPACGLILVLWVVAVCEARVCCRPGDTCYPTQEEIDSLAAKLDPSASRSLTWTEGEPVTCGIPIDSPAKQPLYGAGVDMDPVYTYTSAPCDSSEGKQFCSISVRNTPYERKESEQLPRIVVWPRVAEHVQETVKFARKHSLCMCVVGPGSDQINRHSCNGTGIMLRTSLMNEAGQRTFKGNYIFGAGLTMDQAIAFFGTPEWKEYRAYLAVPWERSVGIVGFSTYSGYGPFGHLINGAQQLSYAEIVLANGTLVKCHQYENYSLYTALRGGGALPFGIVTAVALKHDTAWADGFLDFSELRAVWEGEMCGDDLQTLHSIIRNYLQYCLYNIIKDISGRFIISQHSLDAPCPRWRVFVNYVAPGPASGYYLKSLNGVVEALGTPPNIQDTKQFESWSERNLDVGDLTYLDPEPTLEPVPGQTSGGRPSALIGGEALREGQFERLLLDRFAEGQIVTQPVTLHHSLSLTGSGTWESAGLRYSMFHVVDPSANAQWLQRYYDISLNSHPAECAFDMPDWRERLFGDNYQYFVDVKKDVDPDGFFQCHHCVGAED